MIFENSQETIEIKADLFKLLNNKIGMKISGGADSAIVTYMLAKFAVAELPELIIYPITCIADTKPYQEIYAKRVIEKVTELTGYTNWGKHFVGHGRTAHYTPDQETLVASVYAEVIDLKVHLYGVTANPNPDESPELNEYRQKHGADGINDRDKVPGNWRNWKAELAPLVNVDKKGVAEHYITQGVLEELFPITRSCESHTHWPEWDLEKHCEICYFCQERYWGFGRYV